MTEPAGPQGPIPPKPPLPPKELQRELARQARRQEVEERRLAKEEERLKLEREEAEGLAYHGHHVVDGDELVSTFEEEPTPENIKTRRRWTHGITLALLAGVVVVALGLAFLVWSGVVKFPQAFQPLASSSAAADPNCPSDTFDYPANIAITVNVYNTTQRAGLAGGLATELKARGFQVGAIGDKTIKTGKAGVVVSGLMGESSAFNLQRNIPGLEFRKDDRADASVDVYLASGYKTPAPADQVDTSPGKIECTPATASATAGSQR